MAKRGPKPRRKEVIWSPELAYGIGLMASDGCLYSNGRMLEFTSKDIQQVENLRRCFGVTAKITQKPSGRKEEVSLYFRVQWGDVVLCDFFLSIGLTPHKSLTIGVLKIPDEHFFDFLRGSFDGDGSFYSYFDPRWKNSFMFYFTFMSASPRHIAWLQETVHRLINLKGHVTITGKKCVICSLKFAKKETLKLLEYIYPNHEVMCLERKRLKIVVALGIVGITLSNLDGGKLVDAQVEKLVNSPP